MQRARDRRWVRWTTDLLTLLVVVTGVGAFQARNHLRDVPVPAFTLGALDGGSLSSAALTGKPTLLAFWAPWCTICGAESGNLSLIQKLVGDRARVISIAASFQETAQVQRYVTAHGVDYPVLLGGDAQVREFRVSAFPTVYFLDAQGRVKRSVMGYTTTLGLLWRLLL